MGASNNRILVPERLAGQGQAVCGGLERLVEFRDLERLLHRAVVLPARLPVSIGAKIGRMPELRRQTARRTFEMRYWAWYVPSSFNRSAIAPGCASAHIPRVDQCEMRGARRRTRAQTPDRAINP